MIDPEEYEAWTEHPVTKAVFAELRRMAEDRRDLWMTKSWSEGGCDERALAMLRGQAEGFSFLPEAAYERLFGEKE